MPSVTFIDPSGNETICNGDPGDSVMQVAVANNIPQIEAECGGALACATCHVYVDEVWFPKLNEKDEFETDMLDMAEEEPKDTSRLSCQIKLTDALNGIRIHLTK